MFNRRGGALRPPSGSGARPFYQADQTGGRKARPYRKGSFMVTDVDLFPAEQRILWRLSQPPPVELRAIALGDNVISLLAEADTGGGIAVVVEAKHPFDLEIETTFTTFLEHVPAGRTRYLLTYLDRTDVREI